MAGCVLLPLSPRSVGGSSGLEVESIARPYWLASTWSLRWAWICLASSSTADVSLCVVKVRAASVSLVSQRPGRDQRDPSDVIDTDVLRTA